MRKIVVAVLMLVGSLAHADFKLQYGMPFAADSSTPLGYWRLQSGGRTGQSWIPRGDFFRIYPNTTGSSPWNMGIVAYDNAGNTRKNVVHTMGWNCGTNGSIEPTRGSMCITTESEYGPAGGSQMEHYLGYTAPSAAASYRILTVNAPLQAPYGPNVGLVGGQVGIGSGTTIGNATQVVATSTTTTANDPTATSGVYLDNTQAQVFSNSSVLTVPASGALSLRSPTGGNIGNSGDAAWRFTWDVTDSKVQAPAGGYLVQVNDTDLRLIGNSATWTALKLVATQLTLDSGTSGTLVNYNGSRAFLLAPSGNSWQMQGDTSAVFLGLTSGAGAILAHDPERITVASGAGIIFRTNNTNRARFDYSSFRPDTDGTFDNGSAAQRWATDYVGTSAALPTCDSTTRGGMRTVFAAGGASDTFQICMKAAADTYAWRTVYTAP